MLMTIYTQTFLVETAKAEWVLPCAESFGNDRPGHAQALAGRCAR